MNLFKAAKKSDSAAPEMRAQDWFPVADIRNNFVYRKDGKLLSVLRIYPINLGLLSKSEKKSKVSNLTEWLNSENENVQIFCVGRPIDLAHFQDWQQDTHDRTADPVRKQLLRKLIMNTATLATSGNVNERRFYLIISKEKDKSAESDLLIKCEEIKQKLASAQLRSEICSEKELRV